MTAFRNPKRSESRNTGKLKNEGHVQTINLAQAAVQDFGAAVFWSIPGFGVTTLDEGQIRRGNATQVRLAD
jgi:hypothetical protein